MTARETNLEILRRWYEAYDGAGLDSEVDLIDEVFDPRVEFSPWMAREVEQRTYRGRDGVRAFFLELRETLGQVRYDRAEFHPVSDEVIVVFTRLTGTARGSAVPIANDLGLVYEFRAGLVLRLTAYGSHQEALDAAQGLERAEA